MGTLVGSTSNSLIATLLGCEAMYTTALPISSEVRIGVDASTAYLPAAYKNIGSDKIVYNYMHEPSR